MIAQESKPQVQQGRGTQRKPTGSRNFKVRPLEESHNPFKIEGRPSSPACANRLGTVGDRQHKVCFTPFKDHFWWGDKMENSLPEDEDELEEKINEEEEAETTEGTILGDEVIATDQTEPELVLIDDSEKENFPIEEIEPNGEVLKDKPSEQHVDFDPAAEKKEAKSEIESKMEKEVATSEESTKLKKPEEIVPAIKENDNKDLSLKAFIRKRSFQS